MKNRIIWKLLKYNGTRCKLANALNALLSRACIDKTVHGPIFLDLAELVLESYSALTQQPENDGASTNYLVTEVMSMCSIVPKIC